MYVVLCSYLSLVILHCEISALEQLQCHNVLTVFGKLRSLKENLRVKSSGAKCIEQITECFFFFSCTGTQIRPRQVYERDPLSSSFEAFGLESP